MSPESYYKCKKCSNVLPHHELWCDKCGFYNKLNKLGMKNYFFVFFFYVIALILFYFLGYGAS